MTEDYKPTDNAIAERVNGIIKTEVVYREHRFKTYQDALERIAGSSPLQRHPPTLKHRHEATICRSYGARNATAYVVKVNLFSTKSTKKDD